MAHFQAVWEDGGCPSATRILRRGDWAAPLASVAPGFPAALCQPGRNDLARPSDTSGSSSGRRLALARVADRARPSAGRPGCWSIASGSITSASGSWPRRTTSGLKGAPPSHPELLDWLAVDLVEHGWRLKRLHRLIMTSAVYRQSSTALAERMSRRERRAVDPANELLGRMPHAAARGRGDARRGPGRERAARAAAGRTADAAGLSSRRAGAGLGRGSGGGAIGAAFISLRGGIIRSACSTFLISRSWHSTARDGRPRRRRCSRWQRSTASSCRTRPWRSPSECGPIPGCRPIAAAWSNGRSCWRLARPPSPAELRLCIDSLDRASGGVSGEHGNRGAGRALGARGALPHAALLE